MERYVTTPTILHTVLHGDLMYYTSLKCHIRMTFQTSMRRYGWLFVALDNCVAMSDYGWLYVWPWEALCGLKCDNV